MNNKPISISINGFGQTARLMEEKENLNTIPALLIFQAMLFQRKANAANSRGEINKCDPDPLNKNKAA